MRVLIADKFEKVGIDGLKEIGCDVISRPDATPEDLSGILTADQPDVLIVRSTKVRAGALDAASSLSLVIRAGAGVDNINVAHASGLGIFVANCPGKNSVAVAELVIGLLLSCDRRIPDQTIDLRHGKWAKKEYAKARGLYGRTLGIVGLGQIGREVVIRAQALGMQVVGWSRSLTTQQAQTLGISYAATPIDVARVSDAVTINIAATSDTENLVNGAFIEAMKPGAFLINTSRGTVVDEAALARGVREKGLRCGLDVFCSEPGPGDPAFDCSIAKMDGVYVTHHIGASTDQAQVAIAHEVIRIMSAYVESGEVPNCINRLARSSATHVLSIRHRNRPGVLAHVFAVLAADGINVEEVENIIYHGAEATCAKVHVDGEPGQTVLNRIASGNEDVLSVSMTAIAGAPICAATSA